MVSSVDDILSLFASQWQSIKHHRSKRSSSSEWSYEKIANMLHMQRSQAAQVEANLLVNLFGQQRFFAIDNHTVEQLPQLVRKAADNLRSGESFNYTKLYNKLSVTMGFPTAMGLPFVYQLKNPCLLSVSGEARLRTQPDIASGPRDAIRMPDAVNASADVHFVFSSKLQSKMGFITPFDHTSFSAGLDKDFQINLPIRSSVDVDLANAEVRVKLQPIKADKKVQLVMTASRPFTAQHDILDLSPAEQEPIFARKPQQANFTVGQDMTGMAFRVDAATDAAFTDFADAFQGVQKRGLLATVLFPSAEETIKNYEMSVTYDPQRSTSHSVALTASYDDNQDDDTASDASFEQRKSKSAKKAKRSQHSAESSSSYSESISEFSAEQQHKSASQNLAAPASTGANSQSRQQQFLRRAAAGIRSANAAVIDLSAQFSGQNKAQFVASAAVANSPVDDKSRVLVYLRRDPARAKEMQLALTATSKMPTVAVINYMKALKAEPTSAFQCQIHFGEKLDSSAAQVNIDGQMKQSSARREFVRHQPMSELCEQQMEKGNFALPACRNATIQANRLDQYMVNVHFEKVSDFVKNATYKAYSAARYFGWHYNSENFVNPKFAHGNNKVEMELRFAPDMKSANLRIDAPAMSAEFANVRLNHWVGRVAALHPMYTPWYMMAQKAMKEQYNPTCTVDKTAASTFDNKTYPLNLGNNWHLMMQSVPQQSAPADDTYLVSVLVRDASSRDQKEVKIVLADALIEMSPSSGTGTVVKVNSRTVNISSRNVTEIKNQNGAVVAQFYALPDAIKMVAPESKIDILFDGVRVVMSVGQVYRGQVGGLCGTFTGEAGSDFTAPANCVLRQAEQFSATWALNPTGTVREQQQKAQQADCFRKFVMTDDSVSDAEASRYHAKSHRSRSQHSAGIKHQQLQHSASGKRASGSGRQTPGDCTSHRIQVVHSAGQICFSLKSQPACNAKCHAVQTFENQVDFHCVTDSSAARHWVEMVKQGANPDFSHKGANKSIKVTLPETCSA